jgi:hypothetical protein
MTVVVCELKREWDTFAVLCESCIERRQKPEGGRWSAKKLREFDGRCDDCERDAQLAPGYRTPTVEFVATSEDARLPTRDEYKPPEELPLWKATA